MQDYNHNFYQNDKVELIHINFDAPSKSLDWAITEVFPWPIIPRANFKPTQADMEIMKHVKGIPGYVLVDADRNVIKVGKNEIYKFLDF